MTVWGQAASTTARVLVAIRVRRARTPRYSVSRWAKAVYGPVTCMTVSPDAVTPAVMRKMLAADNGISTSAFQLYDSKKGRIIVTLNNFCKLQGLGSEDRDDILSCLDFLNVDVLAAKDLLAGRI